MVSEGCDIRYHALAFCTAGIESTTIPQAWFEVVPECATYIPPNRLPTPCSTAHNKHHLHLDTVAKAPPLCYHIHTSGASGTDAGTSWVDWAAGEGEAVDVTVLCNSVRGGTEVLREVETRGGTSAEQQQQLERIGAEVEARLLAQRELGEAECTAREEELEHTIYSQ